MAEFERVRCLGCGRTATGVQGDPTDIAPSLHCSQCPPWTCETCGEPCTVTELCSCWTTLEGLPLADIKALLTGAGLSIGGVNRG